MSLYKELAGKGHIFSNQKDIIFFSNENFNPAHQKLKNISYHFLHQVHGNSVIALSGKKEKADGYFTNKKNQALIIKTADCMPVFVSHPEKITALHIGWRGLMKRILTESLKTYKMKDKIKVYVGPHIGFNSFQLDKSSAEELLTPHKLTLENSIKSKFAIRSYSQKNHYFINLQEILLREGLKSSLTQNQFHFYNVDTYKSSHHYSHRRNKYRIGQNYSFIVKN